MINRMIQMEPMTRLQDQVRCAYCLKTFPAYLLAPDTFRQVRAVCSALRELNEGKNLDCWPLISFGGKDADLSAEGCTGIKALVGAQEDRLIFDVGGHKTVPDSACLETDNEQVCSHYDEVAGELISDCGFNAEWTGDEWVIKWLDQIAVPVVNYPDTCDIDAAATAEEAINQAGGRIDAFEKAMVLLSAKLDVLYDVCMTGLEALDK
jgi:hypothetical protein